MIKHHDDEVTSKFSYHDLFRLCKKLMKETTKLDKIISTSKDTIYFLETKNKILEKEIELLREKEENVNQNPSTSNNEPDMCDSCNNLKNEVCVLQKELVKFTQGIDNLEVLLVNQRASYNKARLGYEPKNNNNNFQNKCKIKNTPLYKKIKCK